jgi:hypothetical protein
VKNSGVSIVIKTREGRRFAESHFAELERAFEKGCDSIKTRGSALPNPAD